MFSRQSLSSLPLRELGRRPDIILALTVTFVISMIIIPLPNFLIDGLISINIAASLVVLLVALFSRNALEFSTFPSLLLFTTLFRLGLNISTTRGILVHAHAGRMVQGFGELILSGDLVVGLVIFAVITVVQFLVVAKGAERVAEVGARFTLDAMPGKQMSIDAAARSGNITEEEAQLKRDELGRASQLFGNMDGAMKFVKGDAIAGLIITVLNIVAGVVIGVLRNHMPAGDALELYATLTVGDAVVAQVSSLLVTIAAGVMVTRVEAQDKTKNLGFSMKDELFGNEKVLYIGSALVSTLALMPGLPAVPLLIVSAALAATGAAGSFLPRLRPSLPAGTSPDQEAFKAKLSEKIQQAKAQKAVSDQLAPSVVPIMVEVGAQLSTSLGLHGEGHDEESELLSVYIPQLRDALYLDTGVRFPGVRIRSHVASLAADGFVIRIDDVPVVQDRIACGKVLATAAPERLQRLDVAAVAFSHPISKGVVSLVDVAHKDVVRAAGIAVWPEGGILALHLAAVLRKRAKDFIGVQETAELVERLEKAYPALVKELVPKVVGLPQMVGILRRLVEEQISIRNMKRIAEAMVEFGGCEIDAMALTERVRASLANQLAHAYATADNQLTVVLLDEIIEDTIESNIERTAYGQVLTLAPEICQEIVNKVQATLQPAVAKGKKPVVLTSARLRRFVRKLLETDLPQVAVLSFDELPAELTVQPVGRASMALAAVAA